MGWDGWLQYDGNEIINVERTEAYARNDGAGWFRPAFRNSDLHAILGDSPYTSPLQDDAPWTDPNNPDTYGFYGVYPLSIDGLENSTRTSSITEFTGDGGLPGALRHATRSVVINTVLIGESDAAVDAGFRWLKSALLSGPCTDRTNTPCNGSTLCWLSSEPSFNTGFAGECLEALQRTLLRVVVNNGPTISAKNTAKDGSAIWQVQFTAVAGVPWEYSAEQEIAVGFGEPGVLNPMVVDAPFDLLGHTFTEVACPVQVYTPVVDPLCPQLVPPPPPPNVPIACFTPPSSWKRRSLTIPSSVTPLWDGLVPKITIEAAVDVRNLRFRFFADTSGATNPDAIPCDYCGDLLISFIPAGGSLVIDGTDQTVTYITDTGYSRRADSLIFASTGQPFEWPVLSCGINYIVTVDALQTQTLPSIDFSVFTRAA